MPNPIHRYRLLSAKRFVVKAAANNRYVRVWQLLHSSFFGVFFYWSVKHLQLYVNEFKFRLDKKFSEMGNDKIINHLISGGIDQQITYKELIAKNV